MMGRYKTAHTDERGELIRVPSIKDPIATAGICPECNFCVYHERRETGEVLNGSTPGRCGDSPGECDEPHAKYDTRIFIYRHELREYRARAIVAKMNCAAHPEE